MANLPANINAPFLFNGVESIVGKSVFCLFGYCTSATQKIYSTFRDSDGNKYQVPEGKTLVIAGLFSQSGSDSNSNNIILGYGDTSVTSSVSAPTNSVLSQNRLKNFTSATFISNGFIANGFKIPAEKYPYVFRDSTSDVDVNAIFWCYLI